MQKTDWLTSSPLVLNEAGVWQHPDNGEFTYSDGEAAEKHLRKILKSIDDLSSCSSALNEQITDWVTEYHLSSQRANIIRALNLKGARRILELGCGCGSITRYLGETGAIVDAVEGSASRAEIARLRCQDLSNVNIICANFNQLTLPEKQYDTIVLVGVLEYAEKFNGDDTAGKNAAVAIIDRLRHANKDTGIMVIAIENRLGLKYLLGANEDHYARPYLGLYDYPDDEGVRTYDRKQWEGIIAQCHFSHNQIYYPFPDYKLARVTLSDPFLAKEPHAYSLLYRINSIDHGRDWEMDCEEFLAWRGLHASGLIQEMANSYCVVLSNSQTALNTAIDFDFVHFPSRQRCIDYQAITRKVSDEEMVRKESFGNIATKKSEILTQNLSSSPYYKGPLLSTLWLDAIQDSVHQDRFEALLANYYGYLCKTSEIETEQPYLFDYLPFNIIVTKEGEFHVIEREWQLHKVITPEYVFFRALYLFCLSHPKVTRPYFDKLEIYTIKEFIQLILSKQTESVVDIDLFVDLEQTILETITGEKELNHVEMLISRPFRTQGTRALQRSFSVQLYWLENDHGLFQETRSVSIEVPVEIECQRLRLKLPVNVRKMHKLRIDPNNQIGCFFLSRVELLKTSDAIDHEQSLWQINGEDDIAHAFDLEGIHYFKTSLKNFFLATDNDPNLVCHFKEPFELNEGEHFVVQIEMAVSHHIDNFFKFDFFTSEINKLKEIVSLKNEELSKNYALINLQAIEDKERHIQDIKGYMEDKERHVQTLENRLLDKDRQISLVSDQVLEREIDLNNKSVQIESLQQHAAQLSKHIVALRNSRALRLAAFVRRNFIARPKSIFKRTQAVSGHLDPSNITDSGIHHLALNNTDYQRWIKDHQLSDAQVEASKEALARLPIQPKFSIIMPVYNVDESWLVQAVQSVQRQIYPHWELCIADDCSPKPHIKPLLQKMAQEDERIKLALLSENHGIALASNAAAKLATGDYIALLDHDDELSIDALSENVKAINNYPSAGLIYSDEDKMDLEGQRLDPFFKPDFSLDLLQAQNYICHFTVIKRDIFECIGGFKDGMNGAQDHDLILRAVEQAEKVHHIPRILYHWRKIPGSTAAVYDSKSYAWEAGRKAVEGHINRSHIPGKVFFGKFQGSYRVKREIEGLPKVSIIIPFRDQADFLKSCLLSIFEKTTYANLEIIGINNNSRRPETLDCMASMEKLDPRVKFYPFNDPFNYSAINNFGFSKTTGDHVVLMNNDIQIISPDWIETLLEQSQRAEVGAVGAKLYYPDGRIQHAGVIVGLYGNAGHCHKLFWKDDVGYYARTHITHNVSAVTAALMMVKKALYTEVGGLDENQFGVAYNDVDFCLRLFERGYLNVFTPYCEAIHHESASRGYETTPEKKGRFNQEKVAFESRWGKFIADGDPYYSPHLTLNSEDYAIRLS